MTSESMAKAHKSTTSQPQTTNTFKYHPHISPFCISVLPLLLVSKSIDLACEYESHYAQVLDREWIVLARIRHHWHRSQI